MISEIKARLETEVAALKLVAGAAEFAAAVDAGALPKALPAAFVFLASERGNPSPTWSRTRQLVPASVALMLVARNVADARGEAAQADLDALRVACRDALLGWAPTAECDPLQFESGGLAAFRGGAVWWTDSYRTQYPISSA